MALLNLVRRTNAQPPFTVLLEDAAKLSAQGIGVQCYAWGQVVPDEQCNFTLAHADSPEGHARHINSMFSLSGKTLGAHVLQTGQPISAEKFETQEPMVDVVLQREGVVGGIMVPFHVNGRSAGFLGVYSTVARKWHPDEVVFVETVTHLLVAFFFDRVPDFTELVLMLGSPPQVTKLVCRVARVAGVEHNGQQRYLVGCRFIGRCKR